jgi:hypothetical protein
MKKLVLGVICFCFVLSFVGCAGKQIRYKDKGDNRVSIIEDYSVYEKTSKKMKTKNFFPWFTAAFKSKHFDMAWIFPTCMLLGLPIAVDVVATPFIALYAATIGEKEVENYIAKTTIDFSGQLVDEQGKGIGKFVINYYTNTVLKNTVTDANGFFYSVMVTNKFEKDFTLHFNNNNLDDDMHAFNRGKKIKIINPVKITYTLISNGEISKEAYFLTETVGDKDSFDTLNIVAKRIEWNSTKIILTEQEFYSEKNERLTILQEKKWEEEKIAEEKRVEAERIATEKKEAQEREYYEHHHSYDEGFKALYQVKTGDYIIATPMVIIQVFPNKGFLAAAGSNTNIVYVLFKNTSDLASRNIVWVDGKILGTYTYQTTNGGTNTVPKVNASKIQKP